jgi:glycosyltransferase involved in cell wall biosynthesis
MERAECVSRAVYITATPPEPRSFGKRIVMGGILDHLCRRLGGGNVHLILVGPREAVPADTPYRVHHVLKPGVSEQLRAVLGRVLLPPNTSLQEAAVFSPRLARELAALLRELRPSLEIWDTVRLGQYALRAPAQRSSARRVLYLDDLFSERYRSMLQVFDADAHPAINPGGEFQKLLPAAARACLARPWFYRPLLRLEQELVARSERRQPSWFDATLLVSEQETALLQTDLDRRFGARAPHVQFIPPLLRAPRQLDRTRPDVPRFVFLGGLDFAPNADALAWFLASCREALLAALPDVEILVMGPGSERPLPEGAAWGRHVRWLGWVDDLDAALSGCTALLSPLRVGSGIKIKVLESLARGLPVVGTRAGVQGVRAPDASGCLVADEPEALIQMMVRAHDPLENERLSRAARARWQASYTPEVVHRVYDRLLGLAAA